jgi:16S rRNA (cytosine967-C5)-methyltransferase
MRIYPIHVHNAAALTAEIVDGNLAADSHLERFFRAHRNMGGRDRSFVADAVYGCLRHRRYLEYLSGIEEFQSAPSFLVAAYLWAIRNCPVEEIRQTGLVDEANRLAQRTQRVDTADLPFAIRTSLPDWLANRLRDQLGDIEAESLASAVNHPAPVDIRVNTLTARREQVQTQLAAEGIATDPTRFSPVGLRCTERAALESTDCHEDGNFEVQDEGSQLLSYLIQPKRNEILVDFCAGAGGKSLHLSALMVDTGTIYAFDKSRSRLARLSPRLRRAGAHNVHPVAIADENDARVKRMHGKVDRVLIDAPCSGTGTLRRHPELKWRALDLAKFAAVQRRILAAAAGLVKPGGRLVYATCSVLREENDDVIAEFLADRADFKLLSAQEILARRRIALTCTDPALRLFPHRHQTDGFYAAALARVVDT